MCSCAFRVFRPVRCYAQQGPQRLTGRGARWHLLHITPRQPRPGRGCGRTLANVYSERSQSNSDLLCCQEGSDAEGDSPATFSSARRFISRFARA